MLYSLLHQYIHQEVEGDELYTKVDKNKPTLDSQGWTIVVMERASRFLWELNCGRKDQQLFKQALECLAQVIKQTGSLSLFTDGERRYGNVLFEICHEVIGNGKPGRPAKRLAKGVRVRLKNKGSKKRRGRPRQMSLSKNQPLVINGWHIFADPLFLDQVKGIEPKSSEINFVQGLI
jgi:hypothetical protein